VIVNNTAEILTQSNLNCTISIKSSKWFTQEFIRGANAAQSWSSQPLAVWVQSLHSSC